MAPTSPGHMEERPAGPPAEVSSSEQAGHGQAVARCPPHLASGLARSPWSATGEQDAGRGPSAPEQRVRETPSPVCLTSPPSGQETGIAEPQVGSLPARGGMGRTAQPPQGRSPPVIMSVEHPGGRPQHLPGPGRQGSGVHRRRQAAGHAVTRAACGLRLPLSQGGSPGWGASRVSPTRRSGQGAGTPPWSPRPWRGHPPPRLDVHKRRVLQSQLHPPHTHPPLAWDPAATNGVKALNPAAPGPCAGLTGGWGGLLPGRGHSGWSLRPPRYRAAPGKRWASQRGDPDAVSWLAAPEGGGLTGDSCVQPGEELRPLLAPFAGPDGRARPRVHQPQAG